MHQSIQTQNPNVEDFIGKDQQFGTVIDWCINPSQNYGITKIIVSDCWKYRNLIDKQNWIKMLLKTYSSTGGVYSGLRQPDNC